MITAVVLAAGGSSRMGTAKPLIRLAGRTLLGHVLKALSESRAIGTVVVVVGAEADRVRAEIPAGSARVVENRAYRDGMSGSLRTGLRALPRDCEAFFVVLADEPFVRPTTYDALVAGRARSGARIAVPTYRGVEGNPVLLDRGLAAEAETITGDRGYRELRARLRGETVEIEVEDPGVVLDLDTPEELARARAATDAGVPLEDLVRSPTGPAVRREAP